MPEIFITVLFKYPLFPKKITNPRTTRIDGRTKGTAETAFNIFLPGKFLVASNHAPGSPMIIENRVLKRAWEMVNAIIRSLYSDVKTMAIFFKEKLPSSGKKAPFRTRDKGR